MERNRPLTAAEIEAAEIHDKNVIESMIGKHMVRTVLPGILKTVKEARQYRDEENSVPYEKTAKEFPLQTGLDNSDALKDGNLGALLFINSDGSTLGEDWIAPSKNLRVIVKAKAYKANKTLLHYCNDERIAICKDTNEHHVGVVWKPTPGHANDSECVLLNALRAKLLRPSEELVTGELWLMTERIPCASCTNIIVSFANEFPKVAINVVHLIDYVSEERSHSDFHEDIVRQGISIRLFKYEDHGKGKEKITYLPPSVRSSPYSTKHIYPGATRFGGIGADGRRIVTTWTEDDVSELRDSLLIKSAGETPTEE